MNTIRSTVIGSESDNITITASYDTDGFYLIVEVTSGHCPVSIAVRKTDSLLTLLAWFVELSSNE